MTGDANSIREARGKDAVTWTRRHDLSLGLVAGILVLLALLLVSASGRGQARGMSGEEPNFWGPTYWGVVKPEAEELAAVGFAGSGMGAAAFVMDGTEMPKLHGDEETTHFKEASAARQSSMRLVFGVVFHFKTR
jgi:hypothetical protein